MHRLFFAIFPDRPALAAIERVAGNLQETKVLRGRWLAPEKYHLTVRYIGDFADDQVADVVERARAAAAGVRAPRFAVVLDRVATFRGRFRAPCVLRCARGCEAEVHALWQELGARLAQAGVADGDRRRFLPHVTIAYADRNLDEAIAVEPVHWRVGEFNLVDSHRSCQTVLARWPATD
jgi:2'-5' RNA ligase